MKVFFYLAHPAHYHLFKRTIRSIQESGGESIVTIKNKDVLEALLIADDVAYTNIYPGLRGKGKIATFLSMLRKDITFIRLINRVRPDVLIGTSVELAQVGRLMGYPSIVVNEDDWQVVREFAYLAYPFATVVVAPFSCDTGRWGHKVKRYKGYHELAYLRPEHFQPDRSRIREYVGDGAYSLFRISSLNAYHDKGKQGIAEEFLLKAAAMLQTIGSVYISSEGPLPHELEHLRLTAPPKLMHHVLAEAEIYIGDSQTMAAEAAILGTPSIRINDFVGRIGYLNDLEHNYALTHGFKPTQSEEAVALIKSLIEKPDRKRDYAYKRGFMLQECDEVNQVIMKTLVEVTDARKIRS